MSERVSLRELGRRTGQNPGYLHKLKVKGIITPDADGKYDPAASVAAMAAARDPAKDYMREVNAAQRERHGTPEPEQRRDAFPEPPPPSHGNEHVGRVFQTARAQSQVLEAKLRQLEFDKASSRLVSRDRVVRGLMENLVPTVSMLQTLPDKLASQLAAQVSAEKCHEMLTAAIAEVCAEIAKIARELPDKFSATEQ